VQRDPALRRGLAQAVDQDWQVIAPRIQAIPDGAAFIDAFESMREKFLDVAYQGERLADHPRLLIQTVLEMASATASSRPQDAPSDDEAHTVRVLERRLLEAVGPERCDEAIEVLAIGRLSWRLRDDDNILVGRLESQLLRALDVAVDRLQAVGRLPNGARISPAAAPLLAEALQHPSDGPVTLLKPEAESPTEHGAVGASPRQLVGQPAAPGLATGRARLVRNAQDLGRFRAGEVLVCDAIQPTMTHLVPLASAIVERRGGMLIHGAIIARELGIPCVNGIPDVVEILEKGQIVTVDGHLGIVTVGAPEFDLERG
jgi:pyruvate,water dikinase